MEVKGGVWQVGEHRRMSGYLRLAWHKIRGGVGSEGGVAVVLIRRCGIRAILEFMRLEVAMIGWPRVGGCRT